MTAGMQWGDWIWPSLGVLFYVELAVDLWRRRASGAVLLDLGWQPMHVSPAIAGTVLVIAGLAHATFFHPGVWSVATIAIGFGYLARAMIRRNQIREAGLFGRGATLIRWEKISGYEISPAGSLRLNLQGKNLTFFDVPPECRAEVEKLLAKNAPGAVHQCIG